MILCEANIDGRFVIYFFGLFLIDQSMSLDVCLGLCNAIDRIQLGQIPNALEWHEKIQNWYSWYWVAQQTELVYQHIMRKEPINLRERLQRLVCVISKNKFLIRFSSSRVIFFVDINNVGGLVD